MYIHCIFVDEEAFWPRGAQARRARDLGLSTLDIYSYTNQQIYSYARRLLIIRSLLIRQITIIKNSKAFQKLVVSG